MAVSAKVSWMNFTHLHVASGFSMKYGTLLPEDLVVQAKNLGFNQLALTDRDEIGGAVRFIKSCIQQNISPILGIDVALRHSRALMVAQGNLKPKTPAKGGVHRDPKHPRVLLLARGRYGWSALVKVAAKIGEVKFYDSSAAITLPDIATALKQAMPAGYNAANSALVVLLTADSEFAAAVLNRRPDVALGIIKQWRDVAGVTPVVALASHQRRDGYLSTNSAHKLMTFADQHGLKTVLVNAVRYLSPADSYIADVLDAIRGLIPIHPKYLSQSSSAAYLKSANSMAELAAEISQDSARAKKLLLDTELLAGACALDPVRDLDWGRIYLPELDLLTGSSNGNDLVHHADDSKRAQALLRSQAEAALARLNLDQNRTAVLRLNQELAEVAQLGFAAYFLTVAKIVTEIKALGSRVNVRGSAGGSFLVYLLGISLINPLEHGLLMERFLSANRRSLPDIDIDVESDRRLDIYQKVLTEFSPQRVAAVAMIDTYRVRHAIRDVGAALMFSPGEISALATAFPHIRARDVKAAVQDLPELRNSSVANLANLDQLFDCVAALDSLPRHRAMHPCGVIISDAGLINRVPVVPSPQNFPITVFDKDDVEDLGLIKLDILGVRMQSAIRHAVEQLKEVTGEELDIDAIPTTDVETFALIKSTKTLGCFQIESPGQRELIGKLAPESMHDLIVDISLFRPGPIKSDMIKPFLEGKHGWAAPTYLHPDLIPILAETWGVVVFHEQVMRIFATMTNCSLAQADEFRRALGSVDTQFEVREFFYQAALAKGYELEIVEQVWQTLKAFGSFGFCKAHAAAFALPTYQSAWLKTHYPAAFIAGVLTHDPGMYPKRLILDEARNLGIEILPLDVNYSKATYQIEKVASKLQLTENSPKPTKAKYGIRVALADISGINSSETSQIVAGQPYVSLSDFWSRAHVSRPIVENLIKLGGFDQLHGVGNAERKSSLTRRDLLLQLADLYRFNAKPAATTQLAFEVNPIDATAPSGLREMSRSEQVKAELKILGIDSTVHALSFYHDFLAQLAYEINLVGSLNLHDQRSNSVVYTAGIKVAIQTPPIRSGNRVAFLTIEDGSGPIDLAFFETIQQQYAAEIFNSWLVLTAGVVRKSGPRGISLRGIGCWDLTVLHRSWKDLGTAELLGQLKAEVAQNLSAEKNAKRVSELNPERLRRRTGGMGPARRLLIHASGLAISPYSDVQPGGESGTNPRLRAEKDLQTDSDDAQLPARLWHKSPGSGGR
jgi:error-prone DNA polymerase